MSTRVPLQSGRHRLSGRKREPGGGDVLAPLPTRAVAAWYARLAEAIENAGLKMSALLLRRWLSNRKPGVKLTMRAHPHLVRSRAVADALLYHRRVYLTEEKARLTGQSPRWAGVLPRLEGLHDYAHWDGSGVLYMDYESLAGDENPIISSGERVADMAVEDRDVFTALHGFQLHSDVAVTAARLGRGMMRIHFDSFTASVSDTYHWDPDKRLTVANPDHGSGAAEAVRPDLAEITIYHGNARRLESEGFASWFSYVTDEWKVTDPALVGDAELDLDKRL
jgi:hypothetical protein